MSLRRSRHPALAAPFRRPAPLAARFSARVAAAALLPALLLAALFLTACGDEGTAAGESNLGGPRPPAVVRAAAVETGPYVARGEYVGTLAARNRADLYARSSGPIIEISADLGDRVREGQVLARIEPAEERERVQQAKANLRMAEATLEQRRAALAISETTARRTAALAEQNLVSRQQADSAEAELAGARAQVQLAQAQVEQVRSALSSAEVELDQTLVVAPFDGVVGRRYLDRGAFAAANAPVLSVVDLSTIKITVPIPERDAGKIEIGQPATVRVGSIAGGDFAGRVARLGAVFDPDSATTRAEIQVDNPDGRLKPGMFATVSIAFDTGGAALLVPPEAVLDEDGRSWVFVLSQASPMVAASEAAAGGPGGGAARSGAGAEAGAGASGDAGDDAGDAVPLAAHRLEVQVLGASPDGDRVAVDGDLEAGQRVITLGHEALADGAPVVLAEATS